MNAFCDWLDVTYQPKIYFVDSLLPAWLLRNGASSALTTKPDRKLFQFANGGKVTVDSKSRFGRVSMSGKALVSIRAAGLLDEYLSLLASEPHRLTRLDAALDVPEDGADVIQGLKQRFKGVSSFALTRKSIPIQFLTSCREKDGRETGTCYFGRRSSARVTARIYDKSQELLDNSNLSTDKPITRYELTVKRDVGATLRDAADPTSLFYNFMSPHFFQKPDNVPAWEPHSYFEWMMPPPDQLLPYDKLNKMVNLSTDLDDMISLSSTYLPDDEHSTLLRLLKKKLGLQEGYFSS